MKLIVIFVILLQWYCGVISGSRGRIMNGNLSTEIPPYHATLLISNSLEPGTERLGSGVLISTKHILTAASNINGFDGWRAGFGSLVYWNLIYIQSNGAIIHEEYNVTSLANNIGVIFLSIGVYLDGVQPAALPPSDASFPLSGALGRFSAFSFTDYLGLNFSHNLLESIQTVVPDAECYIQTPQVFCGFDFIRFSSPCAGEQGAGFIINENGKNVIAGIVTGSTRICNALDAKTIYIRVAEYRSWLLRLTGI